MKIDLVKIISKFFYGLLQKWSELLALTYFHMKKVSLPLIGDNKYGDKNHNLMFENKFNWTNLFLHAHKLEFTHPYTNEILQLKADFPEELDSII